jgi:hypothetical protein
MSFVAVRGNCGGLHRSNGPCLGRTPRNLLPPLGALAPVLAVAAAPLELGRTLLHEAQLEGVPRSRAQRRHGGGRLQGAAQQDGGHVRLDLRLDGGQVVAQLGGGGGRGAAAPRAGAAAGRGLQLRAGRCGVFPQVGWRSRHAG